jgi:hypothetical protein
LHDIYFLFFLQKRKEEGCKEALGKYPEGSKYTATVVVLASLLICFVVKHKIKLKNYML